jgi:hypothetical protein
VYKRQIKNIGNIAGCPGDKGGAVTRPAAVAEEFKLKTVVGAEIVVIAAKFDGFSHAIPPNVMAI